VQQTTMEAMKWFQRRRRLQQQQQQAFDCDVKSVPVPCAAIDQLQRAVWVNYFSSKSRRRRPGWPGPGTAFPRAQLSARPRRGALYLE